jgi:transposase
MYYIGLDVHKKTISYCVKDASGQVYREGTIGATRNELDLWMRTLRRPWTVAMEATIFTGWIYDHLLPHAEQVKVAHPLMLRAIAVAKKKNDRIDAGKIADCLRCDFLPECHMASTEIRDRRRSLRYRHLLVRQMVQMKNRVSGLLLETGVSHNKQRLHKVGYFRELLATNPEVPDSIRPLLKLSRETIVRCQRMDYALVSSLQRDPLLAERIQRLRTVPGVGPITALTWALEIGDVTRFQTMKQAISYCGLCGAEKSSADKVIRTPLSKQRNKHIQHVLVEAAKLAPRQNHELALVYEKEKQKGNGNRATLAVARKMVVSARGGSRAARVRTFREAERDGLTTATGWRKREQDYTARRLPGPAVCRLSDGDQTPQAPFELFRDWQRTQTQSSVKALKAGDSKWMSGSAKAGTTAERHMCELRVLAGSILRAPPKRA